MSKNILSLLSLNTNTVDNTIDTTQENIMSEISTPTTTENPMRTLNIITALGFLNAVISGIIGYQHAITVNGSPADPFFAFNMMNTGMLSFVGFIALGTICTIAWHYARKFLALMGIIALTILATPASAFAQAFAQESDMVSSTTTSVIANAFTTLILAAFVAGAFTGIYTIIAKNRKAFEFGVTAVLTLLGAALFISLAGMLLPYTNTGYVAQDMVAISMFSAIVLLTGMSAVTFRADTVLTNSEKARIAAEKARIAASNAAHNAKIDAEYEKLGLEASLEAGYKYSVGISQRIINEKKAASLDNGCFSAYKAKHGLGVEIDWSYGVSRSRYMGYWPNEK